LATLEAQEDRFNRAYGSGLLTIEQLRTYTIPLREKKSSLRLQIADAQHRANVVTTAPAPSHQDIQMYCEVARRTLRSLNFGERRAIVLNAVEKVVGTQHRITISGLIPITSHVNVCSNDRHGLSTNTHDISSAIPFEFVIPLPPPLKARLIVARDARGRIIDSHSSG
jgi:site-specific DNA recombinase